MTVQNRQHSVWSDDASEHEVHSASSVHEVVGPRNKKAVYCVQSIDKLAVHAASHVTCTTVRNAFAAWPRVIAPLCNGAAIRQTVGRLAVFQFAAFKGPACSPQAAAGRDPGSGACTAAGNQDGAAAPARGAAGGGCSQLRTIKWLQAGDEGEEWCQWQWSCAKHSTAEWHCAAESHGTAAIRQRRCRSSSVGTIAAAATEWRCCSCQCHSHIQQ